MKNLQFFRSNTAGNAPARLKAGEIAFNLADKLMFVGDGTSFITNASGVTSAATAGEGFFATDLDISTAVAAAKSYTDTQISALIGSAPDLLNTLNELAAALGNDANFVTTITSGLASSSASITAEVTRAQAAESALSASLNTEELRALAAEGQIAQNLADETTRATAAESVLTSGLTSEIARATAAEATLTSNLSAEAARASAAEVVLDGRLDNIDENLNTKITTILDSSTSTFPDGAAPIADPAYRDGWYFTNDTVGKKINWYFYDNTVYTSTLGTFSCYAVVTLDSVTKLPFFGIYTKPGATGNGGSWYRSRRVMYPDAPTTYVAGRTYLMYFGVDPQVHPELPRITLKDEFNSVGPRLSSEEILTVGLNSDSSAGVNLTKFLVDSVGIKTVEGADLKSLLRFRKPTLVQWLAGFDLGTF